MDLIWKAYLNELNPLIREGLEKNNIELIQGVQSLSCFSVWAPLQTIEQISIHC